MQVGKIQNDTFSKNVIDLCWILYNKPRMVATFFPQRTNAFILFLIVPSLQISCFRKTKEKQYQKYDLNKRIAARLIWQLVIHSCFIFAYIISRRDGENNGFLAGVSLLPSLLARPSRFPRAQNPLSTEKETYFWDFYRINFELLNCLFAEIKFQRLLTTDNFAKPKRMYLAAILFFLFPERGHVTVLLTLKANGLLL